MKNILTLAEVRKLYQIQYRFENKELLQDKRKHYANRVKFDKSLATYRDYINSIEKRPDIHWILKPVTKTYMKTQDQDSSNSPHIVSPDTPMYYLLAEL